MGVTETLLDGDPERYEQRFSFPLRISGLRFVRRPVSITPPEGMVCLIDDGPRLGTIPRRSGAAWKDGRWIGAPFEPIHWTDLEIEDGK